MSKRKPFALPDLPSRLPLGEIVLLPQGEQTLRRFCELYLAEPGHDPPRSFVDQLMRCFVELVPDRAYTPQERAQLIDHMAVTSCRSTAEACRKVARQTGDTIETIDQNRRRYGTPAKQLAARREMFWQQLRQRSDEIDRQIALRMTALGIERGKAIQILAHRDNVLSARLRHSKELRAWWLRKKGRPF